MTMPTIYTSSKPSVLKAYATWEASEAAFDAARDQLIEDVTPEIGERGMLTLKGHGLGSRYCVGFDVADSKEPAPAGWRYERIRGTVVLVPIKRSAAGKALAERISDTRRPALELPGMPTTVLNSKGWRWFEPGVIRLGDVVYVGWSSGADIAEIEAKSPRGSGRTSGRFSKGLWKRGKASDYYRALEAHEDQRG